MRKRYPILMIAWALWPPGKSGAATLRDTLTSKLAEYCIPKDSAYCSGEESATYMNGKCECKCRGMIYDSAARKCIDGNAACSAGSILMAVNASSCPAGFVLAADSASTCPAGFMLDSAPRVCGGATPNCSAGYMIRG